MQPPTPKLKNPSIDLSNTRQHIKRKKLPLNKNLLAIIMYIYFLPILAIMPCIEIDEKLYQRIAEVAKQMETTPEKLIKTILEEWLTPFNPEKEQEVLQRLKAMGYE
jgi:hypothetical protein